MPRLRNGGFPTGSANDASLCLGIIIIDDGIALEGNETFVVALTTADTVILRENMTTITITDYGSYASLACMSSYYFYGFHPDSLSL